MKHSSSRIQPRSRLASASLVLALLASVHSASAATNTRYWDPGATFGTGSGGNGTWATATANWSNGTSDVTLSTTTDLAVFGGAAGTVGLTTAVTTSSMQVATSGYTIGNGSTTGQLSLTPQAIGDGLTISPGVTGTTINLGSIKLASLNSTVNIALNNTDLVDFKTTTIYLSGNRTTALSNSTASGTTTFSKFGVSDKPAGGTPVSATVNISQGNLVINSLGGAGNANGTLSTFGGNATNSSALTIAGNTTGTLTINGNNTLYNNSGAGVPLTFIFNAGNGTLAVGNDNALGARNASNALTGTVLQMNSGTVSASGGARSIANPLVANGNFTIGGANDITFSGNATNSGNSRTVTVNNTANTTFSGNVFLSESATTARTLTIGGTGNATVSGVIANFNGSGLAGGLTKSGTGTLTLSNASNTFTGTTTISGGTLALGANNALASGSAVSLGAGTLDLKTFSAAAPSLALTSASAKLAFDLTGRPIDNGTAFLALNGGFTESSDLSGYTVDFGGFTVSSAGTYKLLSFSSITGTLLDSDFSIANLNLSGVNAALSLSGTELSLVTTSAVPEPASMAALAGLAAVGFVASRRRRR